MRGTGVETGRGIEDGDGIGNGDGGRDAGTGGCVVAAARFNYRGIKR